MMNELTILGLAVLGIGTYSLYFSLAGCGRNLRSGVALIGIGTIIALAGAIT
jgi:hypothetical protein